MNQHFRIERADWTLFASLDTLSQKAGTPVSHLRRLALKELVDNALDAGATATIRETPDGGYIIEDDGSGIDGTPEDIGRLFSINRGLISEKLWRKPTRGALGNGLRVVAGALIGSGGGHLVVTTNNKEMTITPEEDGGSTVETKAVDHPTGTRIEIAFGPFLPNDRRALDWALCAINMAKGGKTYAGKPSVWHYDADAFHSLTRAAGARSAREFIAAFDGCTGARAGEIASDFLNRTCESLTRVESAVLLKTARCATEQVSARRLGYIGQDNEHLPKAYSKSEYILKTGSRPPAAELPILVEAWAESAETISVTVCVNKSPIVSNVEIYRNSKKQLVIYGCELAHIIDAPKQGNWRVFINIITPFMPITSDGKTPNLELIVEPIAEALAKAIRKTRNHSTVTPENRTTQKSVFLENLSAAIDSASGGGAYRPSVRDVYYSMRPYFLEALSVEPKYKYFESLLTDYESENGEIAGLYREERGALYHPHDGEETQLGTQEVERYDRPAWLYNKIIVIEKMGMIEAMKTAGLPEKYDFAPMTSRGFTTRALKDILDKISDTDEPITVYCVTDADAPGSMIYETLVNETKARGARKIDVVNLGLFPWEAETMRLQAEQLEDGKQRKAVAQFISDHEPRDDGRSWEDWLQNNRYELNAMGIPRFLEWLECKLIEHGGANKVIPPVHVLQDETKIKLEEAIRANVRAEILLKYGYEDRVKAALETVVIPDKKLSPLSLEKWLNENQHERWTSYVTKIVGEIIKSEDDG